ncbi:hypothetical protein H072_3765 [Dactylellina haptotyla CBS 200.50]|uniref:Uncharacterized protein n=1 Tax=Dactylellina haptotyla (strain CBS 200.50) TaxID=1284197 RepID=S8AHE1_DACHA|nr:hypothetical protein H072_3765 [Dactylellina haptotyla CBS 200.50]
MEALLLPGQKNGIYNDYNTQPPPDGTAVFDLLSLKGKTAIITGAGGGIGFAAAEAFAEAGANVAIWYNSNSAAVEKAAQLSEKHKVNCRAYKVDVTSEDEVKKAVDQGVRDLNGRLDVFVANAAIAWFSGRILDASTEDFVKILNSNLFSVYYAAKAAGLHFRRQKETEKDVFGQPLNNFTYGSFIVTSSASTVKQLHPQVGTPYSSTKGFLEQFVKGLALEWVTFARVNSVCPGYVTTEMLKTVPDEIRAVWRGQVPMGREGTVTECKGLYLYLATDASAFTTGTNVVIDGGYSLQ